MALKAPNALYPNVTASEYREDRARVDRVSPLDNAILMMIRAHVGKPCPTRREIMEWTCIPRRQVWEVLGEVQARGLIEIEVCGRADPKRRRLRVSGEIWTDWTARRPFCKGGVVPKAPPPVGYARGGDRHIGARELSEQEVAEIFRDSRRVPEIAAAYTVHETTVYNIKAGRTWAHLKLSKDQTS